MLLLVLLQLLGVLGGGGCMGWFGEGVATCKGCKRPKEGEEERGEAILPPHWNLAVFFGMEV